VPGYNDREQNDIAKGTQMVYRGQVKGGVVVLEGPKAPPEGARVSVRVLASPARRAGKGPKGAATLYDRMKPFIGIAKELPTDFSINHDHYLYGAPKRK
jgi:hypothetical protein